MTLDQELILITLTDETEEDEVGNYILVEVHLEVFCDKKSVGRSEFYSAARSGLSNISIFIIHKFEYSEEEYVEYEGERYKVIKTYDIDEEYIELTCREV